MLHPEIATIVDAVRSSPSPVITYDNVLARRGAYHDLASHLWPSPTEVAEVRECLIPTPDGSVAARLFVPEVDDGRATLVYFHGGGFVMGDLDTHEALCRRLADDTKSRLLSVAYRLAPENPFPCGVNDAIAAVRYVAAHRNEFGNPSSSLVVIGDSAGATMAAVAVNETRHLDLPIAAQVLIYPTVGPELMTPSAHEYGDGFLLDLEEMRHEYEMYLGDWLDHTDPRVSLLLHDDLTGLPPTIVVVAQCDPLRDEGVAYAGLLEHFGNQVELLEAEGMIHGFLRLGGLIPDAVAILDDLADHLDHFLRAVS